MTVPTIKPAPAQVTAIDKTPVEPLAKAFTRFDEYNPLKKGSRPRNQSQERIEVSERTILVKAEVTVAQNTDMIGENPNNIKTTIDTKEKK